MPTDIKINVKITWKKSKLTKDLQQTIEQQLQFKWHTLIPSFRRPDEFTSVHNNLFYDLTYDRIR